MIEVENRVYLVQIRSWSTEAGLSCAPLGSAGQSSVPAGPTGQWAWRRTTVLDRTLQSTVKPHLACTATVFTVFGCSRAFKANDDVAWAI